LELPELLASIQKKQGINSLTTLDIRNNANKNTNDILNNNNSNASKENNHANKEPGNSTNVTNQDNIKTTNTTTNNNNNINNNTNSINNNTTNTATTNNNTNINPNNNNPLLNNTNISNNAYLSGILNELKNEHETNVLTLYTKSLNETLAKLPSLVQGEDHCIPDSPNNYSNDENSEFNSSTEIDEDTEMADGEIITEESKESTNDDSNIIKSETETDVVNGMEKSMKNEKNNDAMEVEGEPSIGKENIDVNSTNVANNNNNNNSMTPTLNKLSIANGEQQEENTSTSTTIPQKRTQNPLADRYHNPKKTRKIIIPYETSVSFEESRIFSTMGRSIESFCTPKPIIHPKNPEQKSNINDSDSLKKNNVKDTNDNKIKISLSNKITLKLSSHTPQHPPPIPSVNISDLFRDIYTQLSMNDNNTKDDSDSYFQQPSLLTENSMESNLVKKETTIKHIKSMKVDSSPENNNNNNTTSTTNITTNDKSNSTTMVDSSTTEDHMKAQSLDNNPNAMESQVDNNQPGINLSELLSLTSNKIFNTLLKNEFTADDSLFGSRRGGDIRIIDELSESMVPAIQQQSEESIENRDKKKDNPENKNGENAPHGAEGINGLTGLNTNGKEDLTSSTLSKFNSGNAANKIFLHNNHINIHVHNGGTSSVSNTSHIASLTNDNSKEIGHGRSRSRSPIKNIGITGYMNSAPSTYNISTTSPNLGHKHTITLKNTLNGNSDKDEKGLATSKNSINITLHKKHSDQPGQGQDQDRIEKEEVRASSKKSSTLLAEIVAPTHIRLKRHSTSATYVNEEISPIKEEDEEEIENNKPQNKPQNRDLDKNDTMDLYDDDDEIRKRRERRVKEKEKEEIKIKNEEKAEKEKVEVKLPLKLISKLKLGLGKKSESNNSLKLSKYDKHDDNVKDNNTDDDYENNKMKQEISNDEGEGKMDTNKKSSLPNGINDYKKNRIMKDLQEKEKEKQKEKSERDDDDDDKGDSTARFSEGGLTEEPTSMYEDEFVEEDEEDFMKSFEKELNEKMEDIKIPKKSKDPLDPKEEAQKERMKELFGDDSDDEEEEDEKNNNQKQNYKSLGRSSPEDREEELDEEEMAMEMEMAMSMTEEGEDEEEGKGEDNDDDNDDDDGEDDDNDDDDDANKTMIAQPPDGEEGFNDDFEEEDDEGEEEFYNKMVKSKEDDEDEEDGNGDDDEDDHYRENLNSSPRQKPTISFGDDNQKEYNEVEKEEEEFNDDFEEFDDEEDEEEIY